MVMSVFSIYFTIKSLTSDEKISLFVFVDFYLWCLLLIVPNFYSINLGETTTQEARNLCNLIGKYSNCCADEKNLPRVDAFVCIEFYFLTILILDQRFVNESDNPSDCLHLRICQYRLDIGVVNFWYHHHLHGHHLSVREWYKQLLNFKLQGINISTARDGFF